MSTININYYGASGGFIALWTVLFGTDYRCVFDVDDNLDNIAQKHWNITSLDKWKSTEIWPNNSATEASNLNNKVLFFCGPSDECWNLQKGKRIFIYTDINTQYQLAKIKNAFFFVDKSVDFISNAFLKSYNNIKDVSWPKLHSINEFNTLELPVQKELLETLKINDISEFADHIIQSLQTKFKEDAVWHELGNKIHQADFTVKLQDLISTSGDILLNYLGYSSNKKTKEFIKQWFLKHPDYIQKLLLS